MNHLNSGAPHLDIDSVHYSARPPSNRPVSARRGRPASTGVNRNSNRGPAPIKHEPCSSTLAKFHDGVNFSLYLEPHSKPQTPRHPILEAKEKYKYMTKQKSFVDESLFASNTPRLMTNRYENHNLGGHLTHDYMSNQTALAFSSPLRVQRPDSARSGINQNEILAQDVTNRPSSARLNQKTYIKPWR